MWTYSQDRGVLAHHAAFAGRGYSGHGAGLNSHAMEAVHGVGPIPVGHWKIGAAYNDPHLGPCVMHLDPVGHDAHGRSLFRIHGDNAEANHTASDGCIILGPALRHVIRDSGDHDLTVTP